MKTFGRWFDSSLSDDAPLVGREERQAKQDQAAVHGPRSARVAQAWPLFRQMNFVREEEQAG